MRKKQTSLLDFQKAFSDEAICAAFLFEQRHYPGHQAQGRARLAGAEPRAGA